MSRNGQGPGRGHADGQGPVRRHDAPPQDTAILVGHFVLPRGASFSAHVHQVHQLLCTARGLLRVRTERGVWLLPPSRALWIPAEVPHTTESAGDAVMLGAYVDPASCPGIDWPEPTVVAVTPLLRALVDHLIRTDLVPEARARAEAVLLDELRPLQVASVSVTVPDDPRARAVAEALRRDPADGRSLAEWGRTAGAGARTLARLFAAETGLGFGQWRERLRMQCAMPHLAAGLPLEAVARRVGYASASSFAAAFHRVVGVTPRAYFPASARGGPGQTPAESRHAAPPR
ncbi:AraC family transcriptional regulator [Streptomyces sp. NPDC048179]|uniref:AraC family transcriptional regulator n=1 Tax=Streptomyces sp. NPDC048179 TaxID=3365506 RepID=UPI003719E05F